MTTRNKITKTVDNPLTNPDSEFYISDVKERQHYVTVVMNRDKRLNPLFKRAKFIYVYKDYESKRTFKLMGYKRRTRNYGIAVLADDNHLYYNEYTTKQQTLSDLMASNMSRIFLDGYVIDQDTMICLEKGIRKTEPLAVFLQIVARSTGFNLRYRSVEKMLRTMTRWVPWLIRPKKKGAKPVVNQRSRSVALKSLLDSGWLDFLPGRLRDMLFDENVKWGERCRVGTCVLGIVYLNLASRERSGNRKRDDNTV